VTGPVWDVYESPIGPLVLVAGPRGLRGVRFPNEPGPLDERRRRPEALAEAATQLEQYFAGERRGFELALDLTGSPFLRRVWSRLAEIHYGETITYGELAREVGRPDEPRKGGWAVGRTPTPIVVPCHRVIGADGSLTGYGGSLQRKAALLELERRGVAGLAPEPAWAFGQLSLL
jgi:methylated-DNA-[protein]-cysteine S-methyltransferase